MAHHHHGPAGVVGHRAAESIHDAVVEGGLRLSARVRDVERVTVPVRLTEALDELGIGESVTVRTRIVLAPSDIDGDGETPERRRNDAGRLQGAGIRTAAQDCGHHLVGIEQAVTEPLRLPPAVVREAGARTESGDEFLRVPVRFAVANEYQPRVGHAGQTSFSTNASSWRRLRHSNTPSVWVPYSPTMESPVSQYDFGSGFNQ